MVKSLTNLVQLQEVVAPTKHKEWLICQLLHKCNVTLSVVSTDAFQAQVLLHG